jgi:methylthioribose-1-phosphate isomerase
MKSKSFNAIEFRDGKLYLINQTALPFSEEYIETESYERIAEAIERLEVRGAPAIGIAAAYAVALAFKERTSDVSYFEKVHERLKRTRPTAVNLFYALDEMRKTFEANVNAENIFEILLEKAFEIHRADIEMCDAIAENGTAIFKKKSVVLTHCNTGALATGGGGTALNVIKKAYEKGLVEYVYADETRPLLQGSRLTAFELEKAGVPFSVIVDSASGITMREKKVDLVIVGADRIAANGDTANKIGTFNLAVLCKHFGIPFYIAAPKTTIDASCADGSQIKIEERSPREIYEIRGTKITRSDYDFYAPAFDVTPAKLISGIITEEKIYEPPFKFDVENN